jgi:hypothetical protein
VGQLVRGRADHRALERRLAVGANDDRPRVRLLGERDQAPARPVVDQLAARGLGLLRLGQVRLADLAQRGPMARVTYEKVVPQSGSARFT